MKVSETTTKGTGVWLNNPNDMNDVPRVIIQFDERVFVTEWTKEEQAEFEHCVVSEGEEGRSGPDIVAVLTPNGGVYTTSEMIHEMLRQIEEAWD